MSALQALRAAAVPMYYSGLSALKIPAATRRLQTAGRILCYHNVVPAAASRIGGAGVHMSRDRFAAQMRWLAGHYAIVSLSEFIDRLTGGESLRSTVVIAFDDGYAGVFEEAAPILSELGISATVFLVAEAVGRAEGFWWDQPAVVASATEQQREQWLTDLRGDEDAIVAAAAPRGRQRVPRSHQPADWDTIRRRRGSLEIGVHSATHRSLPTLTDVELDREILDSRDIVQRETGVWPRFFAYPYGRCDARVQARVRVAGYRAALGLEPGLTATGANAWCLPRINVPAGISDAAFEAWTAGLHLTRGA